MKAPPGGAASCYPFTSFEMCDDNGILLGVNKHNNSLIIVDIFNSEIYKNANMAILGTSGSGKTFTMQLMALRMRRKNIQTFIIAPLKGNEFYRACHNIGGEFIQISPASPNCINIMEIRRTDTTANDILDAPNVDKSMLAAKIQKLHIFFSLLIPDMTYEEKQLLDDALIKTYAHKGIINNAKTKIVLNLEDEEAMRVQEILHLSEAETMSITHFERGNGLISTNNTLLMRESVVGGVHDEDLYRELCLIFWRCAMKFHCKQ